jgi:hypothetical protein
MSRSARPEDDDVQRHYIERCRRAQEMKPADERCYFDTYEAGWQWHLNMKSRHASGPYRPLGSAWKVGER